MDPTWLVPVSLAVGIMLGALVVIVVVVAAQRGERAAAVATSGVPDGVNQVLEALESAGIVVDPSNNVVRASPGAMALGLVRGGAVAHAPLLALVDRVRDSDEPVTEDLTVQRGPFGDASLHLSVRGARLGSRYVLLLADDHTEAKRLEEVRRDFVANISHELKTPIGAVGLLAEALESASEDVTQVRRFAARLRVESDRLAQMTQEIIELSRVQAMDMVEKADLVSIDAVVARALDGNRVPAEADGIRLITGGTPGLKVYGDENLLTTAVHNLIANAIQYSPKGSHVGIGVRSTDGVVELSVTDQGVGIPEEELGRVFERFFRVDPARSRHTGGTGLGLSIVKHVVQNHGGDIRVWSQKGHGSTFTIRLPSAPEAPTAQGARS
ncbi:sensor histidine kinase [Lysobacter korlensis]|uniref:histidine kinase n=1 Tax=Lysobacter korlensis TaxID=553636 RepID=A0ABV6RWQ3_9GAMM